MKRGTLFAAALLAACTAFADPEKGIAISREESASMKTIDLDTLEDQILTYQGKIVKLRFNCRGTLPVTKPDGSIAGTLCYFRSSVDSRNMGKGTKYGELFAVVPPEGVDWYQKIPTKTGSRATMYVIAKIAKNEFGQPSGELLGREIRTDAKGPRIYW